jgi:serine/threonine protein kinase
MLKRLGMSRGESKGNGGESKGNDASSCKKGPDDDDDDDDDDDEDDLDYRDESSTYIVEDPESSIARAQESHPVDEADLMRSVRDGKSHARGNFSYHIDDMPVLRRINRQVDLDEMVNLEYVTEGCHSHIFSATWKGLPVIIKMLQADKADNNIAQYEFDIEAELLSRMDHPRVIRSLGSGKVPRPFIVLERLRDASKFLDLNPTDDADKQQLRMFQSAPPRTPQLTFPEVLQIAKDLADALHYCHSEVHPDAMIIHRDLKPENLGLTGEEAGWQTPVPFPFALAHYLPLIRSHSLFLSPSLVCR